MGIKTAAGNITNFKTCLQFLFFKLNSPSDILPTLSALQAIRRFCCSKGYLITFCNSSKGNQRPFCKLQEGIRLPHTILFYFRGFLDLHAVSNPFLQAAQMNMIPFGSRNRIFHRLALLGPSIGNGIDIMHFNSDDPELSRNVFVPVLNFLGTGTNLLKRIITFQTYTR
jgi:hypothetical protein